MPGTGRRQMPKQAQRTALARSSAMPPAIRARVCAPGPVDVCPLRRWTAAPGPRGSGASDSVAGVRFSEPCMGYPTLQEIIPEPTKITTAGLMTQHYARVIRGTSGQDVPRRIPVVTRTDRDSA